LTAAVDHINDRRYHTFAPLELEIKQDYFTEGVKLSASFADVGSDDAEMNVTIPDIKVGDFAPNFTAPKNNRSNFRRFFHRLNGVLKQTKLVFENNRRLSVGRTEKTIWRLTIRAFQKFTRLCFERRKSIDDRRHRLDERNIYQ
jgi:hypothetical protein